MNEDVPVVDMFNVGNASWSHCVINGPALPLCMDTIIACNNELQEAMGTEEGVHADVYTYLNVHIVGYDSLA